MIDVQDLQKNYGELEALRGVSFSVKPGEIIGLLGPNGAGKTTIMKILAGFLQPSSGTVMVGGLDVQQERHRVQEMIGYLPENAPLYSELTVQGQLRMIAELRGIPADKQPKYLSEAIRALGLEERLTLPISTLSKGYRQRVGLAQAILHKPSLLILDEPTNGLDPTQIVEVRHLIRELAHHSTVIVSTHILSEVEATCDRAIIIMNGEVKADSRLADLAAGSAALITIAEPVSEADIVSCLSAIDGASVQISRRDSDRLTFRLEGSGNADLCQDIYSLARAHDWSVCELKRETLTLEAVFNTLTVGPGGVQ